MDLYALLNAHESEHLDFKRQYPESPVELTHDILCLSNAHASSDRYLVFGIDDDDHSIYGVESDPNRKTNAKIHDLLQASSFNNLPEVELTTHVFGHHEVDVLRIANQPLKPYFLTRDKHYDHDTIRAGVVYTRIGDTNTPLKKCAPERHVEVMWQERFGLLLKPLTRFYKLLPDIDSWDQTDPNSIYHKQHPEFSIRTRYNERQDFIEPWSQKFLDPHAKSYFIELWYQNTVLKKLLFVSCDGGRYQLPAPDYQPDESIYSINLQSIGFRIANLLHQYGSFSLTEAFTHCDVRIVNKPEPGF